MWTKTSVLVVCCCCFLYAQGLYVDDEANLRTTVFSNYDQNIRPNDTTPVVIHFYSLSLSRLDIGEQQMTFSLILSVNWTDYRLQWNPGSHGNIETLVIPTENVWNPIFLIENDVGEANAFPETADNRIPLRVSSNGDVMWPMLMHTTTVCEMAIAYYPFDTQTCSIAFTVWGYDDTAVAVSEGMTLMTYYVESGEWELLSVKTTKGNFTNSIIYFTRLFLTYTFRRRWQFYGMNLVMPIVLNSFLMSGVFALPVDTGEKMGYCLTVLLSFVVFLTWISDSLPAVSTGVSVIQVYLAMVLCMGILATLITVWVLIINHRSTSTRMSKSMRCFVYKVLLPFHRATCSKKSSSVAADDGQKTDREKGVPYEKKLPLEKHDKGDHHSGLDILPLDNASFPQNDKNAFFHARDGPDCNLPIKEEEVTWQEVAVMLDKFMLWVSTPITVLLSVIVIVVLYAQY